MLVNRATVIVVIAALAASTLPVSGGGARAQSSPAPVPAQSSSPVKVVVTSKPIHSLVAAVMAGVGTPVLLIDGTASPHTFAMKPSGALAVAHADVLFRVSEALEPFTRKVVEALPATVEAVTLADAAGVHELPQRGAATSRKDPHIWLDPDNARAMVAAIASALSRRDRASAARYASNAAAVDNRIDALTADLARELAPVADKPFVVLHDAYRYFERRFGLSGIGAITVSPDVPPGARRLADLREKVKALGAVCVFSEPFAERNLAVGVTEGTNARSGVLDPEGLTLMPGPELYFTLMHDLAAGLRRCLAPS